VTPLPETIRTDSVRLRQVLLNLVGNAIKFTERGSVRITVRCLRRAQKSPQMQFVVSDTGIGMTPKLISTLFHAFTQGDTSATRRFGGTGLGLAISKRLAEMLGGDIQVKSRPGSGSTFTVTVDPGPLRSMPMLEAPPVGTGAEEETADSEGVRTLRGRVLLAEDGHDIQRLITVVLGKMGLEVDLAENGRVACRMAEASMAEGKPYNLILMDIQMPELDGYQATQRLRRCGWKGPVVALTAHAMTGDRQKCLEAGCDDYLAKPMTPEALRRTVARYLREAPSAPRPRCGGSQPTLKSTGILGLSRLSDAEKADLRRTFLDALLERIEQIERALRKRDLASLTEAVHTLHGAAGLYGFREIADSALRVEHLARAGAELGKLRPDAVELVDLCKNAARELT